MAWNFDAGQPRQGYGTLKWDALAARFGRADLLPLWVADMDFPTPDFIVTALASELARQDWGYRLTPAALADAVAGWMQTRHGWAVQPSWVQPVPGVLTALALAIQTYTLPGDTVVVQPPVYPPFLRLATDAGRRTLENPLKRTGTRWDMNLDHLESCFQQGARLLLLCHPHNPVGRLWSQTTLQQVADLARRYGVWVLADEIHADITYGAPFTPFATLAPELTLTVSAPGKSFQTAALNMAYVISAEPRLRNPFIRTLQGMHLHVPHPFGVAALIAAYQQGAPWIAALNQYLAANRAWACQTLAAQSPALGVTVPEATYLLWLDFSAYGWDDALLQQRLVQTARLALNPGPSFGTGGSGHARLNFALPQAQLNHALTQLNQLLLTA